MRCDALWKVLPIDEAEMTKSAFEPFHNWWYCNLMCTQLINKPSSKHNNHPYTHTLTHALDGKQRSAYAKVFNWIENEMDFNMEFQFKYFLDWWTMAWRTANSLFTLSVVYTIFLLLLLLFAFVDAFSIDLYVCLCFVMLFGMAVAGSNSPWFQLTDSCSQVCRCRCGFYF